MPTADAIDFPCPSWSTGRVSAAPFLRAVRGGVGPAAGSVRRGPAVERFPRMTTRLRIAALTSALAVAAASVLAVGLPASAATTTTDPAPGAAGWLAAQFQDSGGLPAVLGA